MQRTISNVSPDLCPPTPIALLCDWRNCRFNDEGQCQRFWRHDLDETDILLDGRCRFAKIDERRCSECGEKLHIEPDRVECSTCQ